MKKLIIIEGMDNTGKDTLISGIKKQLNTYNIKEEHFTGPTKGKINECAFIDQINQFINFVDKISVSNDEITIWNRSHIGEYVYGQIYRKINKKIIIKLINLIDELLLSLNIKVVYVQLICTSNKIMIDNEDGKSLSNDVEDYEKYIMTLKTERKLFKEAFKIVSDEFGKIMIIVNNGDSFVSKESILNEVMEKIYEQFKIQ